MKITRRGYAVIIGAALMAGGTAHLWNPFTYGY